MSLPQNVKNDRFTSAPCKITYTCFTHTVNEFKIAVSFERKKKKKEHQNPTHEDVCTTSEVTERKIHLPIWKPKEGC